MEYTYTSVSEQGNIELRNLSETKFVKQIDEWQLCLNYLFEKGTRIPKSLLLENH